MIPLPISRVPQATDWLEIIFWKVFIHKYVIYLCKANEQIWSNQILSYHHFYLWFYFSLRMFTVQPPIHTSDCLFKPCLQIPWSTLSVFKVTLIIFTIYLTDLSGLLNFLINLKSRSQLGLLSLSCCLPTTTNQSSNSVVHISWMSLISIATAFCSYYMNYCSYMLREALPAAWSLPTSSPDPTQLPKCSC